MRRIERWRFTRRTNHSCQRVWAIVLTLAMLHMASSFVTITAPLTRKLTRKCGFGRVISSTCALANPMLDQTVVHHIPESVWRAEARNHRQRIYDLLRSGLTQSTNPLNSGRMRSKNRSDNDAPPLTERLDDHNTPSWTALDPRHPVYNFLIEYYGLKGIKGVKRLARWSPSLPPLGYQGVLLEGATADDLSHAVLHLRGAILQNDGIAYNPYLFFNPKDASNDDTNDALARAATPYLWYRAVLQQTLTAEPILYCHGLHEWAMQYHPDPTSPPPASAKYQAHLELRVQRSTINDVVERRGVHCTHVDALRYFAPAAAPLNHHGAVLNRVDQLRLEQPACVHAHMDLLKITLRLEPFVDATLLQRVLDVALQARSLDVAASPYDATVYGVGVVPIETEEGRVEYRTRQTALMRQAEPIRRDLLDAYDLFLATCFPPRVLQQAEASPSPERFAQAEPGGLPWRKNLV